MTHTIEITRKFEAVKRAGLKELKSERKKGRIDEEMLPYLDRLNALPFVVTQQCCARHVRYDVTPFGEPTDSEFLQEFVSRGVDVIDGRWGYLLFCVPEAVWDDIVNERLTGELVEFVEDFGIPELATFGNKTVLGETAPIYEKKGVCAIGVGWDSQQHPMCCEKLCTLLEGLQE